MTFMRVESSARVAHAPRVLVFASRENNLSLGDDATRKVRDGEDAIASTRDARATRISPL